MTVQALVVRTIRPDTVFIPYHWAGDAQRQPADPPDDRSAQQDPRVQGLGLPARQGRGAARMGEPPKPSATCRWWRRRAAYPTTDGGQAMSALAVLHRSVALHRLPLVRERLRRVRHAPRDVDDPRRLHRSRALDRHDARPSACTARTRPAPRSARPTPSSRTRRRRAVVAQAALHRLLQLRPRLPVRRPEDDGARSSR